MSPNEKWINVVEGKTKDKGGGMQENKDCLL